jgi:DNA-binding FrmR family transcriptional regulator
MNDKDLIHRLNRVQGQIEAIRRNIEENNNDCVQNIRLLKAATNALKKFGQAYVETHLSQCLLEEKPNLVGLEKDLKEVVASAFSM